MPNVLTDLSADIYRSADIVGRELVGIIPSVTVNSGSEAAALNGIVRSHFTRPATVTGITPSMTVPEGTDQTVDNKTMTLDTPLSVKIPWTGEDIRYVNNGSGFETVYGDQIRQAMRAITNQIEINLWTAAYKAASRAVGTPGTTPFASAFAEIPDLRKVLADNGMPFDGQVSLVMDTTAGAALRKLAQLQKANEAGGTELLRQGTLLELQGFMLKESAGISRHTKGTGANLVTSGETAIGVEDIALITGTGTVLAGDIVTFAADTANKYIVNEGTSGPGTISLGEPGARTVIPTANALTVGATYTPNIALHRSAVELAMRPYAVPPGGDMAVDEMVVQDPFSGLVFVIRAYKGYLKSMFDVQCLTGVKAWKSEHIAVLAG